MGMGCSCVVMKSSFRVGDSVWQKDIHNPPQARVYVWSVTFHVSLLKGNTDLTIVLRMRTAEFLVLQDVGSALHLFQENKALYSCGALLMSDWTESGLGYTIHTYL